MSASFILPFFVLLIRLKALSYVLKLSLGVSPLYLYIRLSWLTFLSNLIFLSSLSSTVLLNIPFCFEIDA